MTKLNVGYYFNGEPQNGSNSATETIELNSQTLLFENDNSIDLQQLVLQKLSDVLMSKYGINRKFVVSNLVLYKVWVQ